MGPKPTRFASQCLSVCWGGHSGVKNSQFARVFVPQISKFGVCGCWGYVCLPHSLWRMGHCVSVFSVESFGIEKFTIQPLEFWTLLSVNVRGLICLSDNSNSMIFQTCGPLKSLNTQFPPWTLERYAYRCVLFTNWELVAENSIFVPQLNKFRQWFAAKIDHDIFCRKIAFSWRHGGKFRIPNSYSTSSPRSQNVRSCLTKLELHHSLVSHLEDFFCECLANDQSSPDRGQSRWIAFSESLGLWTPEKISELGVLQSFPVENHEILPKSQFGLTVNQVSATLQGHLNWTGPIFKELWNDGLVTLPVLDVFLVSLFLTQCSHFESPSLLPFSVFRCLCPLVFSVLWFSQSSCVLFSSLSSCSSPLCLLSSACPFPWGPLLVSTKHTLKTSNCEGCWGVKVTLRRWGGGVKIWPPLTFAKWLSLPPHLRNLKLSKYASWRSYIGKSDTTEAWPSLHCVARSGPQGNRPSRTHQAKRA